MEERARWRDAAGESREEIDSKRASVWWSGRREPGGERRERREELTVLEPPGPERKQSGPGGDP